MKSKEQQRLDLNKIVGSLSQIRNVIGIVLFGSQARGDYDEFSDYDLLILFENKSLMWENWDKLFQAVGDLKMNLHAIPETLEELENANPVFLDELYKYGKVLFAKMPFEVHLQPLNLNPFSLITYNMRNLNYAEKMKASYFLYSKGGAGAVANAGGIKVSDGCIIVPSSVAEEIIRVLASMGVRTTRTEILANPEISKSGSTEKTFQQIEKPANKRKTRIDSTLLIRAGRESQN
jgi:predicted nucleotidyltransferase